MPLPWPLPRTPARQHCPEPERWARSLAVNSVSEGRECAKTGHESRPFRSIGADGKTVRSAQDENRTDKVARSSKGFTMVAVFHVKKEIRNKLPRHRH